MRGGVPLDIQVHPTGGAGGGTCSGNGGGGGSAILIALAVCCCILLIFSVGVGSSSPQTRERVMLQCQSLIEKTRHAKNKMGERIRRARAQRRARQGAGAAAPDADAAAPPVSLAERGAAAPKATVTHHDPTPAGAPTSQNYVSTGGTIQEPAFAYQEMDQKVKALDRDIHKVESDVHGKTYSMKDLRAKITQAGTMVDRMPALAGDGSVRHIGPIDFIRPIGLNWEQLRQKYRKEREQYTNCPYPEINGSHFLG